MSEKPHYATLAEARLAMEAAEWKRQARKHERRAKKAYALAQRIIAAAASVSPPGVNPVRRTLDDLQRELDALYAEKRTMTTGVGEPFVRSRPADGTQEVIVARSRQRPAAADPVNRHD